MKHIINFVSASALLITPIVHYTGNMNNTSRTGSNARKACKTAQIDFFVHDHETNYTVVSTEPKVSKSQAKTPVAAVLSHDMHTKKTDTPPSNETKKKEDTPLIASDGGQSKEDVPLIASDGGQSKEETQRNKEQKEEVKARNTTLITGSIVSLILCAFYLYQEEIKAHHKEKNVETSNIIKTCLADIENECKEYMSSQLKYRVLSLIAWLTIKEKNLHDQQTTIKTSNSTAQHTTSKKREKTYQEFEAENDQSCKEFLAQLEKTFPEEYKIATDLKTLSYWLSMAVFVWLGKRKMNKVHSYKAKAWVGANYCITSYLTTDLMWELTKPDICCLLTQTISSDETAWNPSGTRITRPKPLYRLLRTEARAIVKQLVSHAQQYHPETGVTSILKSLAETKNNAETEEGLVTLPEFLRERILKLTMTIAQDHIDNNVPYFKGKTILPYQEKQ